MRAVIVGAGALGREVWDYASTRRSVTLSFADHHLAGTRVRTRDGDILVELPDDVAPQISLWLAIAQPLDREQTAARLVGRRLGTMALGYIASDVRLGDGAILLPQSIISVGASAGRGLIVNVSSSIGHDVHLGDWCTISSHVDICGRARIGHRVFIGSGARILPEVTIGDDAVIGAGAVVMADVPPRATMFAMPARRLMTRTTEDTT